jgi:hypothetical protein
LDEGNLTEERRNVGKWWYQWGKRGNRDEDCLKHWQVKQQEKENLDLKEKNHHSKLNRVHGWKPNASGDAEQG